MRSKKTLTGWACCFFSLAVAAVNPIVQTNYTADPAPMVHDGTVYLYTTHDEDVTVRNFFTMNDWRCYSTKDMVNWTDHGAVLHYKDFSWSRGDAWAGQCVFRNGKFYFYVPVNQKNGGNAIGVAVSDSPTGPFKDALGEPMLTGFGYIDPTVFIDTDGQAYLYWGNPQLWYVKLNPDMVSYDKAFGIQTVPLTAESFKLRPQKPGEKRLTTYEEGPWLFKRKNSYYLLYPAGGVPEHLAYSTAVSAQGPWVYGDTIMPVIGKGGAFTNHPGFIEFKGKNYLFYHNGALPGGGGFKRSVCVEPFEFRPDGSIPGIQPTAGGVLESVAPLNPFVRNEAETISFEQGIETKRDSLKGMIVTDISSSDFIRVAGVNFGKGAKRFEASVMPFAGGSIELRLDRPDGQLLGTVQVPAGSAGVWKTLSCPVSAAKGVHDLLFVFKGQGERMFDLDWWIFKQ